MAERYACGNCVAATEPCEKCALQAERDTLRARLTTVESALRDARHSTMPIVCPEHGCNCSACYQLREWQAKPVEAT